MLLDHHVLSRVFTVQLVVQHSYKVGVRCYHLQVQQGDAETVEALLDQEGAVPVQAHNFFRDREYVYP